MINLKRWNCLFSLGTVLWLHDYITISVMHCIPMQWSVFQWEILDIFGKFCHHNIFFLAPKWFHWTYETKVLFSLRENCCKYFKMALLNLSVSLPPSLQEIVNWNQNSTGSRKNDEKEWYFACRYTHTVHPYPGHSVNYVYTWLQESFLVEI